VNFADTLEAPMNAYPDFPLSMALQNYMPVILSGIGLFLVARMVSAAHAAAGRLALAGAALIVVAGTLKASWKLVMALSRSDLPLLSQSLFPLIAPGFTLMAWALFWSQRHANRPLVWWPPALVSAVALLGALALGITRADRAWVFVLIGLSTAANVSLAGLLIRGALQRGSYLAAGLFALNLLITFALSGIAGMPNKPLEIHWTEQIISTISNAGFAWAAWTMVRAEPKLRPLTARSLHQAP
jgi:hypothetical protein